MIRYGTADENQTQPQQLQLARQPREVEVSDQRDAMVALMKPLLSSALICHHRGELMNKYP
jgi:hypothetical protein